MQKQLNLAFSGGGFRATFYTLGGFKRLVECKLDQCVSSISSVSGGSITAAAIMVALHKGGPFRDVADFEKRVVHPLTQLGQVDLRNKLISSALTKNAFPLKSIRSKCSTVFPILLDEYLCEGIHMKDLQNANITWYCNTTCLDTMRMFYFSSDHMYGTLIGETTNLDDISVSFAVAASAAFPLVFSPISLSVADRVFSDPKERMQGNPLLKYDTLWFSDGGVFDNIGTEPLILKESDQIESKRGGYPSLAKHRKEPMKFIPKQPNELYFVLDASAAERVWKEHDKPSSLELNKRILDTSNHQIVVLRRKLLYNLDPEMYPGLQLILSKPIQTLLNSNFNPYFTSKMSFPDYRLPPYSSNEDNVENLLAGLRTDLDRFHDFEIDALIRVGEIRMDIALRALLPEYMENLKGIPTPTFPSHSGLLDILKKGGRHRLMGSLFEELHHLIDNE